MLHWLDTQISLYSNLIQALSAVGSCGAVIVSLWLANRQDTKLYASLYKGCIWQPANQGYEATNQEFIGLTLTNTGEKIIYLDYYLMFNMKIIGFNKINASLNPSDSSWKNHGIELKPENKKGIILYNKPLNEFVENFYEFFKKIPMRNFLLKQRLKFYVRASSGKTFPVHVDKKMLDEIVLLFKELDSKSKAK